MGHSILLGNREPRGGYDLDISPAVVLGLNGDLEDR